jgi:hypothetical protein
VKEPNKIIGGQLDLPLARATQLRLSKPKRWRATKKSGGLHQKFLLAAAFVPLGVEFIRFIEELLKIFKP